MSPATASDVTAAAIKVPRHRRSRRPTRCSRRRRVQAHAGRRRACRCPAPRPAPWRASGTASATSSALVGHRRYTVVLWTPACCVTSSMLSARSRRPRGAAAVAAKHRGAHPRRPPARSLLPGPGRRIHHAPIIATWVAFVEPSRHTAHATEVAIPADRSTPMRALELHHRHRRRPGPGVGRPDRLRGVSPSGTRSSPSIEGLGPGGHAALRAVRVAGRSGDDHEADRDGE